MKKVKKEHWTGWGAYFKWKRDLEKAKAFYREKGINIKDNFLAGWKLAENHSLHRDGVIV